MISPRELIEALRLATRADMREIRSLLGVTAPEHPTLAEITGDPDAGRGFRPKGGKE
jgi:hypothetical protein